MDLSELEIHRLFVDAINRNVGPIVAEAGFKCLTPEIPHGDRSTSYCPFARANDEIGFVFYLDLEMRDIDVAIVATESNANATLWKNYSILGKAGSRRAILASHYLELIGRRSLTTDCLPPYENSSFRKVYKARRDRLQTSMGSVIACLAQNVHQCGVEVLASGLSMIHETQAFSLQKLDLVLSEDRTRVMGRVEHEYWKAKKKGP